MNEQNYTFLQPDNEQTVDIQERSQAGRAKSVEDLFRGERTVAIEGKFVGCEVPSFELSMLLPNMSGADAFNEVYFQTVSGNMYCLYPDREAGAYYLVDARSNFGKGGNNLKGEVLLPQDMQNAVIKVGEVFESPGGSKTSQVSKITAVNSQRWTGKDVLQEMAKGAESNVRREFWSIVYPAKG